MIDEKESIVFELHSIMIKNALLFNLTFLEMIAKVTGLGIDKGIKNFIRSICDHGSRSVGIVLPRRREIVPHSDIVSHSDLGFCYFL
jgi:hypothetical protein